MTNTTSTARQVSTGKVSFLSQIYIISLIFESLLFFIIGSQFSTGFSITIGKMLQILVFILLIFYWSKKKTALQVINLLHPNYRYFIFFFLLAVSAAIVGIISGSYLLESSYKSDYAATFLARVVRSASFRPFIEYLIIIYYFLYFVILPYFLIRNSASVRYFFSLFKKAFLACLIVGFADLVLQLVGLQVLPRDMWEGRMVGFRFHGLAGEPRDAFVYLFFALGIMNLKSFWEEQTSISRSWILIVIIGALLTQSGSGLIGIVFALTLFILYSFGKFTLKKILLILVISILGVGVIALSIYSSQRLQDYIDISSLVIESLEDGTPPPLLFAPQMANVYPVWDLFVKVSEFNFLPVLFGNGFGSASIVNNNMGDDMWNELSNPHSQLIRLIYECGIIGTFFFIKSFVYPLQRLTIGLPKSVIQMFFILTLILIGLNLSHRSTSLFIYFGMSTSILRLYFSNEKAKKYA